MNKFNLIGLRLPALLAAAACLLLMGPNAPAQMMRELKFQELVKKSDHIFTAKCTERKTSFKNGNIVTHYKLKPDDQLKGSLALNKQGEVELEEIGGKLKGPFPMGTYVPGMADIAHDEDVLLFAQKSKPLPANDPRIKTASLMQNNLVITGLSQGRFSILRNPETGEKLVTRVGRGTDSPGEDYKLALRKVMARVEASNPAEVSGGDAASKSTAVADDKMAGQLKQIATMEAKQKQASKFNKLKTQAEAVQKMTRDQREDPDGIMEFETLDAVKARVGKVK